MIKIKIFPQGDMKHVIHTLPAFAPPSTSSLNIDLAITITPDFPVDLSSYKKVHFDLKPFKKKELSMSHLYNITYIMNQMVDIHIFHLRLQQNLICSAFEMNHTLDDNIQHMFLEAVSHYTGHPDDPLYSGIDVPMEFCHVKVTSTSRHSLLQVDHSNFPHPQRSIQIIIQLIAKEHCSHCLLHVSLWENLNLDHQFRYTTWNNTAELQWFCMHPYAFRLQVNFTRPPECSDSCYLLMKFNHFQRYFRHQPYDSYFDDKFREHYTVNEELAYISWTKANKSCSRAGNSLPELRRDISQIWVNMAYLLLEQNSWNPFHEILFIGAYRNSEVR